MNYQRKHRWWVGGDNNGAGATRFLATTFGPRMDRNIFEKHGNDGSVDRRRAEWWWVAREGKGRDATDLLLLWVV